MQLETNPKIINKVMLSHWTFMSHLRSISYKQGYLHLSVVNTMSGYYCISIAHGLSRRRNILSTIANQTKLLLVFHLNELNIRYDMVQYLSSNLTTILDNDVSCLYTIYQQFNTMT